jgi:hypothetical protein
MAQRFCTSALSLNDGIILRETTCDVFLVPVSAQWQFSKVKAEVALVLAVGDCLLPHWTHRARPAELVADSWNALEEGNSGDWKWHRDLAN